MGFLFVSFGDINVQNKMNKADFDVWIWRNQRRNHDLPFGKSSERDKRIAAKRIEYNLNKRFKSDEDI